MIAFVPLLHDILSQKAWSERIHVIETFTYKPCSHILYLLQCQVFLLLGIKTFSQQTGVQTLDSSANKYEDKQTISGLILLSLEVRGGG